MEKPGQARPGGGSSEQVLLENSRLAGFRGKCADVLGMKAQGRVRSLTHNFKCFYQADELILS